MLKFAGGWRKTSLSIGVCKAVKSRSDFPKQPGTLAETPLQKK